MASKTEPKQAQKSFLSFVDKETSLKEPIFVHLLYDDGPKTLLFIGTTYIMQKLFIDKHKQVKKNPLYGGPCIQIQN